MKRNGSGGSEATRSFRAKRPGLCERSEAPRDRPPSRGDSAGASAASQAPASASEQSPRIGGRSLRGYPGQQWERWERSDPVFPSEARRPAIGLRAAATAPKRAQRARRPRAPASSRRGLGAEACGGIQASNGSGGSEATRSFRAKRGAPRSASEPRRQRRSERSEPGARERQRAVAADWGPKLAGVSRPAMGAVGAKRPGLSERSEAPRDRPPSRGDSAEASAASQAPASASEQSPRIGGRSLRGYPATRRPAPSRRPAPAGRSGCRGPRRRALRRWRG